MKRYLSLLLKTLVSILILIYLFKKVDLEEVWRLFRHAYMAYLTAALFLYTMGQILCAYRWKILARTMEFRNPFWEFVRYYFIGMFFNLFLPTAIGGDVGKCYYLVKEDKRPLEAAISILADRGSGLVVLVMISGVSLFLLDGIDIPKGVFWAILLANIFLVLAILIPFFFEGHLSRLHRTLKLSMLYWKRPLPLFQSIMISGVFHAMVISVHILIGLSLGLDIPWRFYFFLIPSVVAVSMLPISLSGLGVREGAYVYFLSLIDIPETSALTFAFGWFLIVLMAGLIGGIVLLVDQATRKEQVTIRDI